MTGEVKIRNDVPVPEAPRRGRPTKIPLGKLCVGCSCTVDSGVKSVRSCVRLFNKNHQPNWKFILKPVGDKKTKIWRTE